MCVSPVRIRNPNYGNTTPLLRATTDCESQYLNVPCGVCDECVAKKQSDLVQRVRVLSLDHYLYMFTLTYNNESLPRVLCSNGVSIPYADHGDVVKMFKRIRYYNLFGYPFKYIVVSERGSRRSRPHFHGIVFIEKKWSNDPLFTAQLESRLWKVLFKEWRRNYGSDRRPVWKPLFNYRQKYVGGVLYRNFDLHYVVPHSTENGSSDVAFYVTKYILKPNDKEKKLQQALHLNLDPDEYDSIWSLVRSKSSKSLNFGSATPKEISFVKSQISASKQDPIGFNFKNPDGSLAPLPRYYRRYVTADDVIESVAARGGPTAIRERSEGSIQQSLEKGKIRFQKVSQRDISEMFNL